MCEEHAHVLENDFALFSNPARIIIAGASNTGKSHITQELIKRHHHKFQHIAICGTKAHPLQSDSEIKAKLTLSEDIIDPEEIKYHKTDSVLYILDDLYVQALQNEVVSNVFTKGRHKKISTIFITQNLFPKGKFARDVSLNATHFILTRMRDLSAIEILGRQLFGSKHAKNFLEAYNRAMSLRKFSYILVDLDVSTPSSLQLRANILGEDECEIVYQWG